MFFRLGCNTAPQWPTSAKLIWMLGIYCPTWAQIWASLIPVTTLASASAAHQRIPRPTVSCTRWLCASLAASTSWTAHWFAVWSHLLLRWPDWQKSAKTTCQWLGPRMHRDLVAGMFGIRSVSAQALAAMPKSLSTSVDKLAYWWWKTLATGSAHMRRVQYAVAVGCVDPACCAVSQRTRRAGARLPVERP